MSLKAKPHVTW